MTRRLSSVADPVRQSLRGKLIAIVAAGILVPLVVLSFWTTRQLRASGEELLRRQLETALANIERGAAAKWQTHRGELLLLADNDAVRSALRSDQSGPPSEIVQFLERAFEVVRPIVDEAVFVDGTGQLRWRVAPDPFGRPRVGVARQAVRSRRGAVAVDVPISDGVPGEQGARMTALVRLSALIETPPTVGPTDGSITIEDQEGVPLAHFGGAQASSTTIDSVGFVAVERQMATLPIRLLAWAPVEPYVEPFQRDARRAAAWYTAALVVALGGALVLVTRATGSLRRLVAGADAVARGNLETRVPVTSRDEVGRLSEAFNSMTQELNRTLRESEQRSALAAVGEFAAELAHEVRNPLTSIRLDLQRVRERVPEDDKMREPLTRALSAVDRLNRTVTGALNVARSGSVTLKAVQLQTALLPALQATETVFASRDITWNDQLGESRNAWVRGDVDALTQLFTNILFNAAEAIDRDGHIDVVGAQSNGHVSVRISDTGPGMSSEMMRGIEAGYRTTKRGGTGIGLTVARRIAAAHGGQLTMDSTLGAGTTVTIRLPRMSSETST